MAEQQVEPTLVLPEDGGANGSSPARPGGPRDPREIAKARGLEFVELEVFPIEGTLAVMLPEALCRRHVILPIAERDGRLVLAMADPGNVFALDDVRTITGRDIEPVVASAEDIERVIQKYAGMRRQADGRVPEVHLRRL
ncbi:MAG: hypothetical protein ACKOI0_01575, partial [Actinomycetota bacterium]